MPIHEACDAYVALFDPPSVAAIEVATATPLVTIEDTEDTMPVPIELAVGASDSALATGKAIADMADSADGTLPVDEAIGIEHGVSIAADADVRPSEGAIGAIGVSGAMTKRRPFFGPI